MYKTYYSNLLIKQFFKKNKAKRTIELLVEDNIDLYNNVISKMSNAFNIDTAEGKQLDIIGSWYGISRYFDNVELKQESPDYPLNRADDETYRKIIKFVLIKYFSLNSIKSTSEATFNFLKKDIIFINGYNMNISYIVFNEESNSNLIEIIKNNVDLLPAPAGVRVNYIIKIKNKAMFGFSTNEEETPEYIKGFSTNEEEIEATFINNNNII